MKKLFYYFCAFLCGCVLVGRAQVFNETTLYSFTNTPDGEYPVSDVIASQDGLLYGATGLGGTNGYGQIYRIARDGSGYQILRACDYASGASPEFILQGLDGSLYGTASGGSTNGVGTIFKMSTNGSGFLSLHAFARADGAYPGQLYQATNGVLFGLTGQGGISNAGTLFRLNSNGGGFQMLHQFTNTPDGLSPTAVIQGADGLLYGTTDGGGTYRAGTIFKISTNGDNYSILYSFQYTNSVPNDGDGPGGNLVQGSDGTLYGTTDFGGTVDIYGGTLFKIGTNGGGYAVLHDFPSVIGDGSNPGFIAMGADGLLYGVAENNGAHDNGMIYRVTTDGSHFQVIYGMSNAPDGKYPGALAAMGDGAFYGVAGNGGISNCGTVFRIAPPLKLGISISQGSKNTNITTLSWPAWAFDYKVQTTPSLSPASWTTIGSGVTNGGILYSTNLSTGGAFFQLHLGS